MRMLDSDFCHAKHDLVRLYGMSCLGVELVELNCWDSILIRDIVKVVFIRLEQSSPLELVFWIELDLNPKFQVKQSPYATQNTCYRGQTRELRNLTTSWIPFLSSASKCNALQHVPSCSSCWLWIADTTTQGVMFMGHDNTQGNGFLI